MKNDTEMSITNILLECCFESLPTSLVFGASAVAVFKCGGNSRVTRVVKVLRRGPCTACAVVHSGISRAASEVNNSS